MDNAFEKRNKIRQAATFLLTLLISLVFVLMFTRAFNPFLTMRGGDSAIFRYVGKVWANGGMPYVDAFDHKGPLIFLINMIPYFFTQSSWGVIAMQVLFLVPTLLLVLKTADLLFDGKTGTGWLFTLVFLSYLGFCYDGGNRVECYGALFDAIALLLFVKYARSESEDVPVSYSFTLGALFALQCMLRANNAVTVAGVAAVAGGWLIIKKRIKTLFVTILFFILGFLSVCVPFVVYFLANGAFMDFLNGTLLYNISYMENSDMENFFILRAAHLIILYAAPCLVCLFAGIFTLRKGKNKDGQKKQDRLFAAFIFVFLIISLIYLFSGKRLYTHYFIVLAVPVVFGTMLALRVLIAGVKDRKKAVMCTTLGVAVVFLSVCSFMILRDRESFAVWRSPSMEENCTRIVRQIPQEDLSDVVAWTRHVEFYHFTGIIAPFRHCFWQEQRAEVNAQITEEIIEYFTDTPPRYFVVEANWYTPTVEEVRTVIETRYTLIDSNEQFNLFRLND